VAEKPVALPPAVQCSAHDVGRYYPGLHLHRNRNGGVAVLAEPTRVLISPRGRTVYTNHVTADSYRQKAEECVVRAKAAMSNEERAATRAGGALPVARYR
jgi:hypothetical protein